MGKGCAATLTASMGLMFIRMQDIISIIILIDIGRKVSMEPGISMRSGISGNKEAIHPTPIIQSQNVNKCSINYHPLFITICKQLMFTAYNLLCRHLSDEQHGFEFALERGLIKRTGICECGNTLEWRKKIRERWGHVISTNALNPLRYATSATRFCMAHGLHNRDYLFMVKFYLCTAIVWN
jgi:hypothetical protein